MKTTKYYETHFAVNFDDGSLVNVWAQCTGFKGMDTINLSVCFYDEAMNEVNLAYNKDVMKVVEEMAEKRLLEDQASNIDTIVMSQLRQGKH